MFAEPLGDFFSTAEHAEDAEWDDGTTTTTVQVIFDNEHAGVGAGSVEISSTRPEVLVQASQVPTIETGHTLTIRGEDYEVRDVRPDETGGVLRLVLEAA
jgi:hypothetical protein